MTKKKPQKHPDSSKRVIDIGKARIEKIYRFRAKRTLEGRPVPTVDQAINTLIDQALALEFPETVTA